MASTSSFHVSNGRQRRCPKRRLVAGALWFVLTLMSLAWTLAPELRADEFRKRTVVTFNRLTEVPGALLKPGTYVFKLADSSDRHVVQVWNQNETELLITILANPIYRANPTPEPVFELDRPGNWPQAVRAWFYSGDTLGYAFMYSKTLAELLNQLSRLVLPREVELSTENVPQNTVRKEITRRQKRQP